MWNAITSVLIVACPCALLLSTNFTYGNIVRIFGLNKFYLKSPEIIESLSKIKHIVFDKTGTLTQNSDSDVRYIGTVLSAERRHQLASLLQHSAHPASKMVLSYLNEKGLSFVNHFKEIEYYTKKIIKYTEENNIDIKIDGFEEYVNSSILYNASQISILAYKQYEYKSKYLEELRKNVNTLLDIINKESI